MTISRRYSLPLKGCKFFLYLLFLLLVAEGTLRLQQKLGPLSDLEFQDINPLELSNVVNHGNVPGRHEHLWRDIEDLKGQKFIYEFDENGLRVNRLRPRFDFDKAYRILFMGDSFMLGLRDEDTIPQHVWNYFQTTRLRGVPVELMNAGTGSYSPAILIVQAKLLIPKLKPHFVVVDIDETDLGDDFIRYRPLMVRDAEGRVAAVRETPIRYEYLKAHLRIKQFPLYLIRYPMKLYQKYIVLPQLIKKYRGRDDRDPLSISADKDPAAREKYAREIDFFRANVAELMETLIEGMGGKDPILVLYHPHLQHLKPDGEGFTWNRFVSETLEEVTREYGVAFYNSTEDLRREFGREPGKFYLKGDMHFNFVGARRYGNAAAKFLFPLVAPKIEEESGLSFPKGEAVETLSGGAGEEEVGTEVHQIEIP